MEVRKRSEYEFHINSIDQLSVLLCLFPKSGVSVIPLASMHVILAAGKVRDSDHLLKIHLYSLVKVAGKTLLDHIVETHYRARLMSLSW